MRSVLRIAQSFVMLVAVLVFCSLCADAQSGRAAVHGYVAFEDVAYNDVARQKLTATVELRGISKYNDNVYSARTDEHGLFELNSVSLGEFVLRISAPGYKTYQTEIYLPSDFICNLAVLLKKEPAKTSSPDADAPKTRAGRTSR
jgi:hypothetical protein